MVLPCLARLAARCTLLLLLVLAAGAVLTALPQSRASASSFSDAVLAEAARHQGKPYVWGATGPGSFDCSGFTGFVYAQFGVQLPRTSADQYAALPKVANSDKQPGDLVFTYDGGGRIYHVGIYAGGNAMWASPKAGDHVRLQTIWTSSYKVARPVPEAIRQHWVGMGGQRSPLGGPTTGELRTPDRVGAFTHYQSGSIYWTPWTGPQSVRGSIRDTWARTGWEGSALGYPTTDELGTPDRVGRFNHFQRGSVYWTPGTGAREVRGSIRDAWSRKGWEGGPLGYPTTDELDAPDRVGRFNHFQRGSIYWTPATNAREVRGSIRDQWSRKGWETGVLGYPTTDELPTPDRVGRFNHFQRGSIYWTPGTGAHEVTGAIRENWASKGWEGSALGYPTSGELATPDRVGRFSRFQGGAIYWAPTTGAQSVVGPIHEEWLARGAEAGELGYPISESRAVPGGQAVDFQRGTITRTTTTGALAVTPR